MSRYLGPIHHWLFDKIVLFESLEKDLMDTFRQTFGDEVEKISEKVRTHYGQPLENLPLEELIDTNNIHGWLQQKISIAETRQAAFLTEIFNNYGQKAIDIALSLYKKQGSLCGNDAKSKGKANNAIDLYKGLNDYILDGMPCDNVNNVSISESDHLEWKSSRCLHRGYWESAGADLDVFYQLRNIWIKAFIENANKNFIYKVTKDGSEWTHKIIIK